MSAILVKRSCSQVKTIFVEVLNTKLWGNSFFFTIKPKRKLLLENGRHDFLDNEKNFAKTKFQTNFIRLRTVGAP